jgi:CheY-like chemotaxis protein
MQHDLGQLLGAARRPVKRVLVVDDDPDVLGLFARMLRVTDGSLEIVTAQTGEAALSASTSQKPDLVLLDVLMPGMDGWQVLARLHANPETAAIPVVLLSGQDPADHPPTTESVLVTVDSGLSVTQLLACSLELPSLLMRARRLPV